MPPLPAHSGAGGDPVYRPDPSNTRVLLRSLEDLRDSLSARVEQLSGAVDRLRGQASELEHAVSTGTPLAPGFGRPAPSGRLAPLITTFTTVTSSRRPLSLAARIERGPARAEAGPSSWVEAAAGAGVHMHLHEGDYRGHPPTNLAVVASQPAPIVVRSPAASVEPEPEPESQHESRPEPEAEPDAQTNQGDPTAERFVAPETPAQHTDQQPTNDEGNEPRVAGPIRLPDPLHSDDDDDSDGIPEAVLFTPFPHGSLSDRLPPGLTTRGMMVQERTGSGEPRRRAPPPYVPNLTPTHAPVREADRAQRDAERLDRAIARYQRRQDESQREFATAWERERQRGMHGGRLPNEHSVARAEAMRRHVDNAHRLWNLIYQRDRLRVPTADRERAPAAERAPPPEAESPDQPLPLDAMRHILGTSGFIRRTPAPRRPRRLPSLGGGVPASPRPSAGEIVDLERGWIDRVENERAGIDSQPTPDQFEYEYYRDFLFEDRQRRRRATDDWPAQRLRMMERLSRLRAWREEGTELFPDTSAARSTSPPSPRLAPLPGSPELPPLAPLSPLAQLAPADWRSNRSQLLEYIEESRARVHTMARELSPDVLAEERPGMRRVLEGIERMLAGDSLGHDVRIRLERLAARERELLGDPPRGAVVPTPAAPFPSRADVGIEAEREHTPVLHRLERMLARGGLPSAVRVRLEHLARLERERERGGEDEDEPADVLERIERARARVRELSRISRELAAVRADMGLVEAEPEGGRESGEGEERARARRDSDAETVVPSNWGVGIDDAFGVLSLQDSRPGPSDTSSLRPTVGGSRASSAWREEEKDDGEEAENDEGESESGRLRAGEWVLPPRGRELRPYVSLLDL